MWKRLKRLWPYLYEALSWLCLGLASGAFLLALFCYLAVRGHKESPGGGEASGAKGEDRKTIYHENRFIIPREHVFDKVISWKTRSNPAGGRDLWFCSEARPRTSG